jgi:hypothetical protein
MRDLHVVCVATILTLTAGCDSGNDGEPDGAIVVEWDSGTSLSVQASYEVCTGERGACSESCCASRFSRTITTDEAGVTCGVAAVGDGSYQVSFTASSTVESQPTLAAQGLVIRPSSAGPTTAEGCTSFDITESGTTFSTSTCNAVDVRTDPPGGGGCLIEASISTDGVIDAQFQCEEIGAQAPFLSTLYGDGVGPGELRIAGCQLQAQ